MSAEAAIVNMVAQLGRALVDAPDGVEVHTRDAIGGQLVVARLTSDTLPTFGASATGRGDLAQHLALRLSASSLFGVQDYDTASSDVTLRDRRRATTGTLRWQNGHWKSLHTTIVTGAASGPSW